MKMTRQESNDKILEALNVLASTCSKTPCMNCILYIDMNKDGSQSLPAKTISMNRICDLIFNSAPTGWYKHIEHLENPGY